MKTRKKTFFILSAVLGISIALYIWVYSQLDYQRVVNELKNNARQAEHSFNVALEQTERQLQQLAISIAGDVKHQQLLLLGKRAVELEGGGAGGELAAQVRNELYDHVIKNDMSLLKNLKFQQLQFHLDPALSFLRINKPEKFGDRLDSFRFTIVTANQEKRVVSGFELGRTVAALRGVSPVDVFDGSLKKKIHVGSVEIATSFQSIVDTLHHQLPWLNIAVLLDGEYLQTILWPEAQKRLTQTLPFTGKYFVDATTSPQISSLLQQTEDNPLLQKNGNHLFRFGEHNVNLLSLPLRDFRGKNNFDVPDAGRIVLWEDVCAELNAYHDRLLRLIFYGVLLFLNLECIIYVAINIITSSLRKELEQTQENEKISEKARLVAEESSRLKTEFLSTISHELRTPLNAIIGLGHILNESLLTDQQQKMIDKINISSHKLLTIIDEILLLNKLDKEQLSDLPLTTFNPFLLVQKLTDEFANRASQQGICVKCHCEDNIPQQIAGYVDPLEQVLRQLLGNAIKFSNGHDVTLSVTTVARDTTKVTLEFAIIDKGIGIAEDQQAKIFKAFHQCDSSSTRNYGGTGLGLTVADKVIRRLGETINVTSALGEGSCFSFQLSFGVASSEGEDVEGEPPAPPPAGDPVEADYQAGAVPVVDIGKIMALLEQLDNPLVAMKPHPCQEISKQLKGEQCPGPWCDDIEQLINLIDQYRFSEASEVVTKLKKDLGDR